MSRVKLLTEADWGWCGSLGEGVYMGNQIKRRWFDERRIKANKQFNDFPLSFWEGKYAYSLFPVHGSFSSLYAEYLLVDNTFSLYAEFSVVFPLSA